MELYNCPDEFFNNCKNRHMKCERCIAGTGTELLHYRPERGKKTEHPVYKELKNQKRQRNRRDRERKKPKRRLYRRSIKKESEVSDAIKKTVASGRVNQDGDYQILEGEIQADHKYHSKSKSFTLSAADREKGKDQGTNTWFITNSENETMVVMPLKLYKWLISIIYNKRSQQEE